MASPEMYVNVAVTLPLHGPFTYSVPPEFNQKIEYGKRVTVPFGKRIVSGFVVDLNCRPSPDIEIKSIIAVSDEPSYFSQEFWDFVTWAADYYFLPNGLVFKTALPAGSDKKAKKWVVLTEDGKAWAQETFGNRANRIFRSGSALHQHVSSLIGTEALKQAVAKGFLVVQERITPERSPKTSEPKPVTTSVQTPLPELTSEQANAVQTISQELSPKKFSPYLLFGVTGSGKTEVYLRLISQVIQLGRRALVLVPEIALTPQLVGRFVGRFGNGVGVYHSGLTQSQRLREWKAVVSGETKIAVAARSGIFLPFNDLGLIVVDEEHDPSYKQEDSCCYNARDLAVVRAKQMQSVVILGSATPSFESFINASEGKYKRIDMPTRVHGGGLPKVELVDLKTEAPRKFTYFTPKIVNRLDETLKSGNQAVIFLNRRGFDTYAQCRSCGHVFKCPNCDISLTHHKKDSHLKCHICGFATQTPKSCPNCADARLLFGGIGTEKVEGELVRLFPDARIARLDRDSTRKRGELESILERFKQKEIDILTGTQMIVKGHDFPGIGFVGVLCGDLSLHYPDFRASERTFQLLAQVAGRTGRETDSGIVLIQTFDPEHDAIRLAAQHDYEAFFKLESSIRMELTYPPFGRLICIRVEGNSEKRVEDKAVEIGRAVRTWKQEHPGIHVLGPAPAPRKMKLGKHRRQLLLKSTDRMLLRQAAAHLLSQGIMEASGLKITLDVDPVDLM